MLSLSSTVAALPDQLSTTLGQDAVILNMTTGMYYGLDPVGARIWALVQQPRTVAEIRDILLEEFEVGAAQLELDLMALLADLEKRALIEAR